MAESERHEGMCAKSVTNSPAICKDSAKVRLLRRRLWVAAKGSPGRRFHALYDRIHRGDILWEAWETVRRNRGCAGLDRQSIQEVEEYGVARLLSELQELLRRGQYRSQAAVRRYIPKPNGKKRPLGIPTVRDRIVQAAAKLVLEPVFEADFKACSFGFRPKRSATGALEAIRMRGLKGGNFVLDADIEDYFGSIDHDVLMGLVRRRISDRRTLKLLRGWLEAGVLEEGKLRKPETGTPQGGVISPLLSNIYLNWLDTLWQERCSDIGTLVRYADDFVVLCDSKQKLEEARHRIEVLLGRLRLRLNPEKTREVELTDGKGGFEFLGCHLRRRMSGARWEKWGKRHYFLNRWPSTRSMNSIRRKIRESTERVKCAGMDLCELIKRQLNPVLRGWGNYFCTGNAARKFLQVDAFVVRRLRRLKIARYGRHLKPGQFRQWTREYFEALGLYRLRGTIRYPGGFTQWAT